MNEGEKLKKKVFKRGDVVTFRLLKKINYSNEVIEFLNAANRHDELNIEIIEAIELYAKYKKFRKTLHGTMNKYEADFFKAMSDNLEVGSTEVIDDIKEEVTLDSNPPEVLRELKRVEEKPEKIEESKLTLEPERKVITVSNWNQPYNSEEDPANEIFDINSSSDDKPLDQHKPSGMAKAFKSLRRS